MFRALRVVRFQPNPLPSIGKKTAILRLPQAKFVSTQAESQDKKKKNMSNTQNPSQKTGDVMSHPFGEGYATRSDDEGFGGIYAGNQSFPKPEDDKHDHADENHPDYDKSQGSHVEGKEKGRHQVDVTKSNA
ncbi:late embryogenesis abundant protein [Thalictrum thalictroides]|uniref:Late embryogenesis abundant protein n=1 Tax=Thalictrum thalictroides TaxID=46969 RepID=A0A7J6VZX9_THATH|nr:late embryogenesis abundant protein [Thalictrum thalictroides]